MSKRSGCCYVLAVLLVLAILAVALILGLKSAKPTLASDSAQVTLANASTPTPSYSTITPPTTPSGECYFCYKDKSCRLYPASAVLPTAECPLDQVRWGATCAISFEVLVIAVSVVAGVLGLALLYCCCRCWRSIGCCCCGGGCHTWRDFQWARDNRANQMNPNNWRFWRGRGYDAL
ncbi:PTTG1IP [Branchiostoma lanceolatum]|uniref:PTTG1IP protein n=1 Tax=Branchiostoma lanceolatum TaxID=7740 RepID=A0A8J9ZWU8_BRALA|nr:PTTG1IP [Branchiostoma lanceolatum]